MFSIKL